MEDYEKLRCKVCGFRSLLKFVSFGDMPAANAFLKKEDLGKPEYTYKMEVGFCENCKMAQLIDLVPYDKYIVPDDTGKTHYAFFSSTSKAMESHFANLASEVESKFLESSSQVLEVGSNDGILLKAFKNNKVLGIEPSQNVAEVATGQGIETITNFFSENLARELVKQRGHFRSVLSTNVFLNILDINDFMRGVRAILDQKGVFITEDPYILDILEKVSYDQIYDEHVWYFSLHSLSNLCNLHGMEVFDAERQRVHGGSMRVYMCKRGEYPKTERLKKYLEEEEQKRIHEINPYLDFAKKVKQSKEELSNLLYNLKFEGKKIVGYAAASKGTIVQNYCNIGTNILDYISDSTPFKQGRYTPGKHIPIISQEEFRKDTEVDYALLGAWNHAEEIMKKEKEFLDRGGKFIVHYPRARILDTKTMETPKIGEEKKDFQVKDLKEIKIKKLKIFANDQGYLFETIRADDEIFDGKFGQVLVSELYPGVIKGLHKHEKQTDYTTCIKGNIKYIVAKETSDPVEISTYVIGESNPILIKVPPGYWHGYMSLSNKEATVLHMMDKTFDPNNDDTQIKGPFEFGDIWTVNHG